MGICLSCVGREDSPDVVTENEQSRLLANGEPDDLYGALDDSYFDIPDADVEAQRETEVLQRVTNETAECLIDVYDMELEANDYYGHPYGHPYGHAHYPYQRGNHRQLQLMRYQSLLRRITDRDDDVEQIQIDWVPYHQEPLNSSGASKEVAAVPAPDPGLLVSSFSDAHKPRTRVR